MFDMEEKEKSPSRRCQEPGMICAGQEFHGTVSVSLPAVLRQTRLHAITCNDLTAASAFELKFTAFTYLEASE